MKILAIETATEACSAALWIKGEVLERFQVVRQEHSQQILGMVERLLNEAGVRLWALDALAYGRGPGSFTGVRIAAGIAQGLAYAAELPVAPVSTLAAMAQGACEEAGANRVLAALDARMGEVYWGGYTCGEEGVMVPVGEEVVVSPDQVPVPEGSGWTGVGSGWASYETVLRQRLGEAVVSASGIEAERLPRARDVAILSVPLAQRDALEPPHAALPVYLRDRVARKGR